jgi:hypothetical protein
MSGSSGRPRAVRRAVRQTFRARHRPSASDRAAGRAGLARLIEGCAAPRGDSSGSTGGIDTVDTTGCGWLPSATSATGFRRG